MRSIGMDVHRSFAQVAIHEDGVTAKGFGIDLEHDAVAFGESLRADREVVPETTGSTAAIVGLLTPFVARVAIANLLQVKAIAPARVKTDKVDAAILAQPHAAGFVREVWAADDETLALRRLVSERVAVVRSIRRARNRVHAVLHGLPDPEARGPPRRPSADGAGSPRRRCRRPSATCRPVISTSWTGSTAASQGWSGS